MVLCGNLEIAVRILKLKLPTPPKILIVARKDGTGLFESIHPMTAKAAVLTSHVFQNKTLVGLIYYVTVY